MLAFEETKDCCGCIEVRRDDVDGEIVGCLMHCVDWLFDTSGEVFASSEMRQIADKMEELNKS